MSYVGALGSAPSSALTVVLTYLRAQGANTIVAVSDANGSMGLSGGGGYLVIGSSYYNALPPAVRAQYPLGSGIVSPLVPSNARAVASAGNLLAAIERALAPAPAAAPPAKPGMSKGAKIAIAVGVLGGVYYFATRRK